MWTWKCFNYVIRNHQAGVSRWSRLLKEQSRSHENILDRTFQAEGRADAKTLMQGQAWQFPNKVDAAGWRNSH